MPVITVNLTQAELKRLLDSLPLAQEVAAIDPTLVNWHDGEPWSIRWSPLQVRMLAEIQRLRKEVNELRRAA